MGANDWVELFVYRVIGMGPTFAVMAAGAVLAARNITRCPRSCWALFGAMGLTLFNNLALPFAINSFFQAMGGFSPGRDRFVFQILMTLPYSIVGAASWGLILFAIFDGRAHVSRFPPEDDPDRDILDR